MKQQKKIIILMLVVAIILIISGIFFKMFSSDKFKNLVFIEDVKISKKSNYDQNVYSKMIGLEDIYNKIYSGNVNIADLDFTYNEDYSDCSGNVIFSNNNDFKNWKFNTNCNNEESGAVDLDFNVLDMLLSNLKIVGFQKVSQGYLVLTSENNDDFSKSYVLLVNKELEVIWKSSIQDSVDTMLKTELYDVLEVDNNYYVLGYASNVVSGDFIDITDLKSEFAFIAKYDFNGNRQSIIPIGVSRIYNFLGHHNNKVYGFAYDKIITVENGKVDLLKLDSDTIFLKGMTDKYYYGYKDEIIKNDDGTSSYGGKIQILNLDGTLHYEKSIKDIKECSPDNSCSIYSMIGNNNNLMVAVDDQLYIMDYDGNIEKKIDYSKVKLNGKISDTLRFDDILMLENSYVVISNPTTLHVMIEEYDFNHNLLYRKVYYFDYIQLLYGLSEEFAWYYDDKTLYRVYTFIEPVNNLVTWSVK